MEASIVTLVKRSSLLLLILSCSDGNRAITDHLDSISKGMEYKIQTVEMLRSVHGSDSLDKYQRFADVDGQIKESDSLVTQYQNLILSNIKAGMKQQNPELKVLRDKYLDRADQLRNGKDRYDHFNKIRDSLLFDVYSVRYTVNGREVQKELHIKDDKVIN